MLEICIKLLKERVSRDKELKKELRETISLDDKFKKVKTRKNKPLTDFQVEIDNLKTKAKSCNIDVELIEDVFDTIKDSFESDSDFSCYIFRDECRKTENTGKSCFRNLSRKLHPDKGGDKETMQRLFHCKKSQLLL